MVLTGGTGEVVGVEFVNSKHASFPASFDLLWQHASTVQKPAAVGSYCINGTEKPAFIVSAKEHRIENDLEHTFDSRCTFGRRQTLHKGNDKPDNNMMLTFRHPQCT